MTDSEFINGIANDTLGYGDIIAFAKEYPSIKDLFHFNIRKKLKEKI